MYICNQLQGPILYYIKVLETEDIICCSTSLYKVTARTEHIMWEEEDNDVWMIEADDSWFPDVISMESVTRLNSQC